ncbi:MAG: HPr kinase/phosphatase C-terminal domain-containing protein [Pseudomonadota bacterium]
MSAPDAALHANAVAFRGRGLLITGRAGSGKTSLSVEMMALGADLIADDRVVLRCAGGLVLLSPPDTLAGLVELRGIGIIRRDFQADVPAALVLNLNSELSSDSRAEPATREETDHDGARRLPDPVFEDLLGLKVRRISQLWRPGLAAAMILALQSGELLPGDHLPGQQNGDAMDQMSRS